MIRYSEYLGGTSTLLSGGVLIMDDPYKNRIQIDIRDLMELPYDGLQRGELKETLKNKTFNIRGCQPSFDDSKMVVFMRDNTIRILYKDRVTGEYKLSEEFVYDKRLQSRFEVVGVVCSKTDKTAEFIVWCHDRKIARTTTRLLKEFDGVDLSEHTNNKFNLGKTLKRAMKNPGEICLL